MQEFGSKKCLDSLVTYLSKSWGQPSTQQCQSILQQFQLFYPQWQPPLVSCLKPVTVCYQASCQPTPPILASSKNCSMLNAFQCLVHYILKVTWGCCDANRHVHLQVYPVLWYHTTIRNTLLCHWNIPKPFTNIHCCQAITTLQYIKNLL